VRLRSANAVLFLSSAAILAGASGYGPLPYAQARLSAGVSQDAIVAALAQQPPAPPTPPQTNDRPARAVPEILLPVLIDERYLGDVGVQITGDMASINAARLVELLSPELTEPTIAGLRERAVGGRLTTQQASGENIIVRFNPQLQQIEVTIPVAARQVRTLSMSNDLAEIRTGREERPAGFSLYASTRFSPEYRWNGQNSGFDRLNGQLDLGGRIGGYGGIAFLSRHSYSFSSGQPAFTREETSLIYDDVERLIRVTAGDLVPRGTGFQSVPLLAGVSVERLFSLQPERLFRPIGNSSFQLDEPATVQVRINGVVQRELVLQAGRYNLRDLPLTQGSNLVDIVIRDNTGREVILSDRNFFDFDLLAPGITEFSASLGVRTRFGTRAPVYSDEPVFSGFARRGLSETLTAGLDAQADQSGVNGGVQLLWASPVGVFRLQAAGSTRDSYGSGAAAELGYRLIGTLGSSGATRFSLDLRAEHRTANFSTVADLVNVVGPVDVNQPTATLLNFSGQIFRGRFTGSASASYNFGRAGRPNNSAAIVGVNYQLSQQWTVGVFARHIDDGVRSDQGGFLQLIWRPSQAFDARGRYDSIDRETQISARRSASRTVGSLSFGGDLRYNDRDREAAASADAFYTSNRFEAALSHRVSTTDGFSDIVDQRTRLTIGTSIAFANGALAIGRPIRDSFAIVTRHATLGSRTVRIDETDRGYTASTDLLGPALATELSGYSSRSIYYSVNDLPPGYDLGSGQFVLRPPLNAGYRLTVGTDASYSLIGQVRRAVSGDGLAYVGGALYSLDDPQREPIAAFTNRNGRLVATGLRPGRYRLELGTEPRLVREITISAGSEQLVDIGIIEVAEP
jgi:outer membrane usher protein